MKLLQYAAIAVSGLPLISMCSTQSPLEPKSSATDNQDNKPGTLNLDSIELFSHNSGLTAKTTGSSYDPSTDASMALCLDNRSSFYKDVGGTVACADGDSCAYWSDRSGKGYHAKALSGANKPIYRSNAMGGVPGLVFAGNKQLLSLGTPSALTSLQSTNFTLIVAATYHANSGWIISKNAGASDGAYSLYVFDSLPEQYVRSGATKVKTDELFTLGISYDPSLATSGIARFYQNGGSRSAGTTSTDSSRDIEIGSISGGSQYYSWNGRIFAVYLFSRTLSPSEVLKVD